MSLPREGALSPDLARRVAELLAQVPEGSGFREAASLVLQVIEQEEIVEGHFGGPSDPTDLARIWEGRVHWIEASILSRCGIVATVNALRERHAPVELVGIETKGHRAVVFLDESIQLVVGCICLKKGG